jgi:hypothetical protein
MENTIILVMNNGMSDIIEAHRQAEKMITI